MRPNARPFPLSSLAATNAAPLGSAFDQVVRCSVHQNKPGAAWTPTTCASCGETFFSRSNRLRCATCELIAETAGA